VSRPEGTERAQESRGKATVQQLMSILRSGLSLYTQVYAYEDQIDTMKRVVSPPPVTTTWTVDPPLILGPGRGHRDRIEARREHWTFKGMTAGREKSYVISPFGCIYMYYLGHLPMSHPLANVSTIFVSIIPTYRCDGWHTSINATLPFLGPRRHVENLKR
jgi:hypothetical protein